MARRTPTVVVVAVLLHASCVREGPDPVPPGARDLRPVVRPASLYALALRAREAPAPREGFYLTEPGPGGLRVWSRPVIPIPLELRCRGRLRIVASFRHASRKGSRLQVAWNGRLVHESASPSAGVEMDLTLPEDVGPGSGVLELRFPDAIVPHDLDPRSPDVRELGATFGRLEVSVAGAPGGPRTATAAQPLVFETIVPSRAELFVAARKEASVPLRLDVVDRATNATIRRVLEGPPPWRIDLAAMAGAAAELTFSIAVPRCDGTGTAELERVALSGAWEVAPSSGRTRVALIGLDGATWHVMDPLLREGRLPRIASLLGRGVRATLCSLPVDHSPIVWATIATGRPPEAHGILDFTYPDPKSGKPRVYTARHRRAPTLWEILGSHGHDVGVIGWWNSWPAAPVRGFLVSDMLWPYPMGRPPSHLSGPPGQAVYPEELAPVLLPLVVDEAESAGSVERLGCSPKDWFFAAEDLTSIRWAMALLAKERPELFSLYLKNLDAFQHRYWRYLEPDGLADPDYRPSPADVALRGVVIPRYYELLDETVGQLEDLLGKETDFVIVSDHGAGPALLRTRVEMLSGGHRPEGIFIAAGPSFEKSVVLPNHSVYDVTPTLLHLFGMPAAEDMPGSVMREALRDSRELPRVPSYQFLRPEPAPATSDLPREEDLLDRLESLGYIGS